MMINNKLKALNGKVMSVILLMLAFLGAQAQKTDDPFVISESQIIQKAHAAKFGELLVQDMDGRIKPVNTLASEFTRKLYRSSTLKVATETGEKLDANQVFLALSMDPGYWQDVPIIKIDQEKGAKILELLELDRGYLSFTDLFDETGNYLLAESAEVATRKKPSSRNEFDKELLAVNERFNILFQAFEHYYLKLFPNRNDPDNTWHNEFIQGQNFPEEDSMFVVNILRMYRQNMRESIETGDWSPADTVVAYIAKYQSILGEEVIPSPNRIQAELKYNQWNIFSKLFGVYWLIGLIALILAILKIFLLESKAIIISLKVLVLGVSVSFALHTFNIILRWYAGGYPPWSNGYEMIILVSWFLMLFGFVFLKRSDFVLPLATLFTGTLMFVAFLDWLNPEITNLVPVLKSYWLKIHVAIIVGSYAPLALSALLGLLSLVFLIIPKTERLSKSITELSYINEMSMTIGLFMLAIGTFLGGVWANESWGRYWGWDPKETWALISVIVYTTILHLRLVPQFKGIFTFNLWSVFGFYGILMTSYGVNYYLSGLHSYATGDPVPIPRFVFWVTGILITIAAVAYFRKDSDLKAT
jgi:cytochrome c-type biogenesis protein CcsB